MSAPTWVHEHEWLNLPTHRGEVPGLNPPTQWCHVCGRYQSEDALFTWLDWHHDHDNYRWLLDMARMNYNPTQPRRVAMQSGDFVMEPDRIDEEDGTPMLALTVKGVTIWLAQSHVRKIIDELQGYLHYRAVDTVVLDL